MKEYYLKPSIIDIFTVDTFTTHGVMPEFIGSAVFMWIIYQRTEEESKIHTIHKSITSISEISFCLN